MDITFESRVAIDPDVVFRDLDGEAVILHLGTGLYYGLDPVGTRMWTLLAEYGDLAQVFATLREEFDVSADTLRADLLRLVRELHEKGLVRVSSEVS